MKQQNPSLSYRIEHDSLGEVPVPESAYWGPQTQRAVDNFPYQRRLPMDVVYAIVLIKHVAAQVNYQLGVLSQEKYQAIEQVTDRLLLRDSSWEDQFPVDIYQTGSGTSSNMNVNEVIAHLCQKQCAVSVHPNDDVNASQSSNDTFPTAIHLGAMIKTQTQLQPAITRLRDTLDNKRAQYGAVIKTGRTHLMDAMPVSFDQVFDGWQQQLAFAMTQLEHALAGLRVIPQGGTAVGNGVNCPPGFSETFCRVLSQKTRQSFQPMRSGFAGQGALDRPLAMSSALQGLSVVLIKIANDLRWMNSGPLQGLGEIQLPAVQPGSSIMPGKVNPVICESVLMAATQVNGLNQNVALAAQSGSFELNVMMPLVAANLDEMIHLLSVSTRLLAEKAIAGLQVNTEALAAAVQHNPILVTALNAVIGYEKAAEIAQKAYQSGETILDVAERETGMAREKLAELLDPVNIIQRTSHK